MNGAGHEVEGFATRASLLPGYTVEFKLRSLRAEALRVDVYRHGYYPVSYTHLTLPTICSV